MFSTFLFEIIGTGAVNNGFNQSSAMGADIMYPLLSAASIFVGGVGVVMLFVTLFSYFLGAGDEDKMAKAHNSLFSSFGMIIVSVVLFFLAKMFL